MFLKVHSEDPMHQNLLGCWLKIQILSPHLCNTLHQIFGVGAQ